jgi:hypothetical protein
MKLKSIFLLTSKKLLLILVSWVVAVVLHNLVYGLFQDFFDRHETDEPFFFIIAIIVIPLYLLICLVYTGVYYSKIKPKEKSHKIVYLATVISLLPGVVSLVMDPDLLGIMILIVHALLVYIAWRAHFTGGIVLIVLAGAWLGLLIYNAILGPIKFPDILLWMIFTACPLAGGIMFIRLGKRKK